MSKDVLVTVGGVLALGAVLFGAGMFIAGTALQDSTPAQPAPAEEKKDDAHGEADKAHTDKGKDDKDHADKGAHGDAKADKGLGDKGHGDAHAEKPAGKDNSERAEPDEEDEEYISVLERKYNDHFARGMYEEARSMALKAQNIVPKSMPWQRRLADATFSSDELAAHQRYQRAYEIYSSMIATDPTPRESEWPRYRSVLCLRNTNRWEEAAQTADAYLALYKSTPRAMEIALIQAQCQFALGDRPAAKKNIEKLLAQDLPKDQRAAAMLELAHIERETPPAPAEERAEVINVADLDSKKTDKKPVEEPAPDAKPELSTLVPKAQWESIRNAAQVGNLLEAQRLISPWLDPTGPLNSTQRAKISLDYASLLRELTHAAQKQ